MRNMTFSNINYVMRGNGRHVRHLWGQLTMAEGALRGPASLVERSEYLQQVSSGARARFEAKISSVGLNVDRLGQVE